MENKINYSLVIAILNRGFSDVAMSAARNAGAKGGTVISARTSTVYSARPRAIREAGVRTARITPCSAETGTATCAMVSWTKSWCIFIRS